MTKKNILTLLAAIGISEGAGLIGSVFTAPSIPTWYASLQRPEFSPPNWIFGPVWTTLYALMGIAAWLVWSSYAQASENKRKQIRVALTLFGLQLVLNTLWSIIFFGWQNPGAAFAEISLLWLAILATIIAFARVSRPAAWLLLPYLLWVSFAAYFNYAIWTLNPAG